MYTYDGSAPFPPPFQPSSLSPPSPFFSNLKLRWAGHVRRMDWSRVPRKFPHIMGRRTSLQRTGTLLRARPHARAPADQIQHRQGGRAARRVAELGGCRSRQREMAQARCSATAGACPCGNETHKRGRNGLSLRMLSRRPIQLPSPGRNDCSPGGRPQEGHHNLPYHVRRKWRSGFRRSRTAAAHMACAHIHNVCNDCPGSRSRAQTQR
jgi:hypothetical protein